MSRHIKKRKSRSSKGSRSNSVASSTSDCGAADPDEGPVFEVRTSKLMGRYMVSKKDLRPGDVILSEEPLVVGPCSGGKVQCLGCYKVLEESISIFKCICGWPLCQRQCPGLHKKHGHTKPECSVLRETQSSRFLDYSDYQKMRLYFNTIVPLRCLLLKSNDPGAYQQLMTMETHNEIRRNVPDLWMTNQLTVVDKIREEWGLKDYNEDEIHSICGILEVNSFEIGHNDIDIRGLYPRAFLMSHDCVPNTNHIDEEGTYKLTVRASTKIDIDEPITLSYAYTLQSTIKRREHLLENKFFECQCRRCSDPTELGTYTGALMCPKCKTGFVISTNPLDSDAPWSCGSKKGCPGYTLSAKSMQLLNNRISQEVESINCNDIKSMESFLQKYRNVLHPTHYLCLGIKLSLSQLYGKIHGYFIDQLSDQLLLRKKEICEEIIKIFDIIEPGYTKLRGVTLYEMHAPLMILLTRQFQNESVPKNLLKSKLKVVVKCLEEASVILGFEPEGSSEGMMGVAARDALVKIKEWEKILGKL